MLLGFGYLYEIVMFFSFFFFQKAENKRLKKWKLVKILYYFFVFA